MKIALSAVAILLSIACSFFSGAVSSADLDSSASPILLAQVDSRQGDAGQGDVRRDPRYRDESRPVDQRNTKTDNYASRTTKGVGKEGLTECHGEFAYCGASTCKPTGKKIKVKEDGGKATKEYEEAACKCPIIDRKMAFQNGVALHGIAAVNEGNMNGSCRPPSKGTIWSYAELGLKQWPQQSANWETKAPIGQVCPVGSQTVNCWNFLCTVDAKPVKTTTSDGQVMLVRMATCRCPINEGVLGHQAGGNEVYGTAAGGYFTSPLTPTDACSMYPVSGAVPQPS